MGDHAENACLEVPPGDVLEEDLATAVGHFRDVLHWASSKDEGLNTEPEHMLQIASAIFQGRLDDFF